MWTCGSGGREGQELCVPREWGSRGPFDLRQLHYFRHCDRRDSRARGQNQARRRQEGKTLIGKIDSHLLTVLHADFEETSRFLSFKF